MTRILLALIALTLASCVSTPSDQELLAGPNAVQHLTEGRPVDVPPALADFKATAPYSTRYDLVLTGRRATFRVAGPQPIFLSAYPSSGIKLYRLERGVEKDDRNLKVRARTESLTLVLEIPTDVWVEVESSREGDGLYRVAPRAPLPPGEYAFMSQADNERWQKYPLKVRLYSFGVD
jgi:hypothetical protein